MGFNIQVVFVDDLPHLTVHSVDCEMHLHKDDNCICYPHEVKYR